MLLYIHPLFIIFEGRVYMLNKTIHNSFCNYESLDEYLLSIGVPPSKIANSKKDKVKKLGSNDEFDLCYDFIREEK